MYSKALTILSAREGLSGRGANIERGARYLALGVRLADELEIDKALKLSEPLALATNTPVVIAKREKGLVVFQFELAGAFWESYTRADVKAAPGHVGLGLSDGHRQVNFDFDPPHCLIAGTTGAGKSEAVKSLLCGLFTAYKPGELSAVIVDPDGDHADSFRNVAHLQGVDIASDSADIDNALTYAHQEFITRKRANRRDGAPFVIVIDEAEDALESQTRIDLVQPIARHGRKYNVNLILATQKPSENALPGLLDKINHRFVGLVQSAHLSAHLTGQAGLDCHKLTGQGDFIRVAGAQTDRLLVALATSTDLDRLPRAELSAPAIVDAEVVEIDDEPDTGGRPREEVDPDKLAYYVAHQIARRGDVSRRTARETLDLGYTLHKRHQDFAAALIPAISRWYQELRGA